METSWPPRWATPLLSHECIWSISLAHNLLYMLYVEKSALFHFNVIVKLLDYFPVSEVLTSSSKYTGYRTVILNKKSSTWVRWDITKAYEEWCWQEKRLYILVTVNCVDNDASPLISLMEAKLKPRDLCRLLHHSLVCKDAQSAIVA